MANIVSETVGIPSLQAGEDVKYLLDTHYVIWAAANPDEIEPAIREIIIDPAHRVFVSMASLWEIQIKKDLGKLPGIEDEFFTRFESMGYDLLGIRLEHILSLAHLPPHHRDPFDRLLVAQAMHEQLTLITRDSGIRAYAVNVL